MTSQGTDSESYKSILFKIIEPAIFNHADKFYLDRALKDLEELIAQERRKAAIEELKKVTVQNSETGLTEWNAFYYIQQRIKELEGATLSQEG